MRHRIADLQPDGMCSYSEVPLSSVGLTTWFAILVHANQSFLYSDEMGNCGM